MTPFFLTFELYDDRHTIVRPVVHTRLTITAADDSRLQVERKIDEVPARLELPTESTLRYDLPDHKVTFYFDGPGEQMSHVMVKARLERKNTHNV